MKKILPFLISLFGLTAINSQNLNFVPMELGPATGGLTRDIITLDIDNDNDLDVLVVGGSTPRVYINTDGLGTFDGVNLSLSEFVSIRTADAKDMDGDGDKDLVVGTSETSMSGSVVGWFANTNGMGTQFGAFTKVADQGDEYRTIAVADYDGDDDMDIAFGSYETDEIHWAENTDGQGNFGTPQLINGSANGIRYLIAADAENDGDMDLYSSSFFSSSPGQFSLFRNDGSGTFTKENVNGTDGNNPAGIAVGHLDNDDDPDVLGCIYNSDAIFQYINEGPGNGHTKTLIDDSSDSPFTVQISDLENDGDVDIVAAFGGGKVGYYLNDGSGNYSDLNLINTSFNFINASFNVGRLIALGDAENDGDVEIFVTSIGENKVYLLKNQPALTYEIHFDSISCFGGQDGAIYLDIKGGTLPYTITWQNPFLEGDTILGLSAGIYPVVISDDSGTSDSLEIEIWQPPIIMPNTGSINTPENISVGSAWVNPTGGTPPFEVQWSNGVIGDSIFSLSPDSYGVMITDANGCTATDTIEVIGTPSLSVSTTTVDPTCFGAFDGVIDVTITGGVPPYTFSIDGPAPNPGYPAGQYTIGISDSTGILIFDMVTLNDPPALDLNLISTPDTLGLDNGTITAIVAGGIMPYQFDFGNGPQSDSTIQNIVAGDYAVTITDANGCTIEGTVEVGQVIIDAANEIAGLKVFEIAPNPSSGIFSVRLKFTHQQDLKIDLVNADGKVITMTELKIMESNIKFDLQDQPPGLYLLKLSTDSATSSRRIVLVK